MSCARHSATGNKGGVSVSFRVCINCYGIRVYPYMGFMVGQQYECQDCGERMVIPLEFDNEAEYKAFRREMLGDEGAEDQ